MTDDVLIECEERRTIDEALVAGDGVSTGRVVLSKLELSVGSDRQRLIPSHDSHNCPLSYILTPFEQALRQQLVY